MSDAFESMRASWRRSYLLFAVFSAFAALFRVPAVPVLWGGTNLLGSDAQPRQSMGFAATMFALLLPSLSPNQLQSPAANRTVKWVLRWLAPAGATVWPPLLFVVIVTRNQVTAVHLFTVGRYCAFLIYSLVLLVIFTAAARVPRRIKRATNGSAPA
ncbi:MAG: hypothetical protein QOI66_1637 [Myxococcales bacterium]|jgi:hypothetical protein|nr:hypothetical protein [Myxococcales bacterium]